MCTPMCTKSVCCHDISQGHNTWPFENIHVITFSLSPKQLTNKCCPSTGKLALLLDIFFKVFFHEGIYLQKIKWTLT